MFRNTYALLQSVIIEPVREKTNNLGSYPAQHKPACTKKIARSLKFRMEEEEGLYYPCSENKGADQLRGSREADLRLCFRPSILFVFLCSSSIDYNYFTS